jgi:hypothetical protein
MVDPLCCKLDVDHTALGAMCWKPYDYFTLSLAQLASRAADIIALCRRANHHPTALRGYRVLVLG